MHQGVPWHRTLVARFTAMLTGIVVASGLLLVVESERLELALEAVVMVLATLGIVMIVRVSRRLYRLMTSAQSVAGGALDTTFRIPGGDEVAALGAACEGMTANLRASIIGTAAAEARRSAILDATADGIVTIDERGMVRTANAAVERMFGYAESELAGGNVNVLMPSPHHEQHDGYLARYVRTGEGRIINREREVEAKRKDGTTFDMALRVREMQHAGERLFIGVLQDITQRRLREAERERTLDGIRQAVAHLTTSSTEMLAAASQLASGAQQQTAAVTQTVATVDEVTQTSEQAAERARGVAESAKRAAAVGREGQSAVSETVERLDDARQRVQSIADSILGLADRAQAIGDIIATVNDIADQTNLLALNAGIEAARAGEHGRGFSVVAGEVKALAEQSKRATEKVREILGQIQEATNTAVIATEEGTKSVGTAVEVSGRAGDKIRVLGETIGKAAQAAAQIAASATQQATGMGQIHQAMRSINQASQMTLSSGKQLEQTATELNGIGAGLEQLVGPNGSRPA